MKIAILGTRGIPNHYSGFEQFAEFFSVFLVEKGHDVYVYNSHNHLYQEKTFNGVNIIHQYDPEYKLATFGQFIYDFNCIIDSRKRDFDIILQLGYTSNSIWHFLLPKNSIIITNMDGLEWKRTKYSKPVQQFLKFAEKLAVKSSDFLIKNPKGTCYFTNYEPIEKYLPSEWSKARFIKNTLSIVLNYSEIFRNEGELLKVIKKKIQKMLFFQLFISRSYQKMNLFDFLIYFIRISLLNIKGLNRTNILFFLHSLIDFKYYRKLRRLNWGIKKEDDFKFN